MSAWLTQPHPHKDTQDTAKELVPRAATAFQGEAPATGQFTAMLSDPWPHCPGEGIFPSLREQRKRFLSFNFLTYKMKSETRAPGTQKVAVAEMPVMLPHCPSKSLSGTICSLQPLARAEGLEEAGTHPG